MLAASKQLEVLETSGERVRDFKHLEDLARPTQSAAGQSGSFRQTNHIEAGQIWDKYVIAIGKDPLAANGSQTCPLFVNLQDVIGQDGIEAFGAELVDQLGKLTNWNPGTFAHLETEGHGSALLVRGSISSAVSDDLGPKLSSDDLLEMVRRIQASQSDKARGKEWRHKKRAEFPGPSKSMKDSQYKSYVKDGYRALVKEKQCMFIKTLTLNERVVVVVHALLTWYHDLSKSGRKSLDL